MFFVTNLPAERATDHADSAGIFQIPNHPCSSVPSVVKNSESGSVSSVFSVGTLPTVLTKDYADSAGISVIAEHPCSSVVSVVKNSESVFRVFRVFRGHSTEPINHRSHRYDLDENPDRLFRIPSIPHPLPIRGKNVLADPDPTFPIFHFSDFLLFLPLSRHFAFFAVLAEVAPLLTAINPVFVLSSRPWRNRGESFKG